MNRKQFAKKQSKEILNLKIGLERTVTRELKSYFYQLSKIVEKNGKFVSIENLLNNHYTRIVRRLTHRKIQLKQENDKIDQAIRIFLLGRALKQADIIDTTTQEDIAASIQEARELLREDAEFISPDKLRKVAAKIFYRKSKGRITTIANTETQERTEGIRETITLTAYEELMQAVEDDDIDRARELAEASGSFTAEEVVSDMENGHGIGSILIKLLAAQKMWMTMGDNKVRTKPFNHRNANGQTAGIRDNFEVSGELLKYPGDTSLGASIGNIINCRCVSVHL